MWFFSCLLLSSSRRLNLGIKWYVIVDNYPILLRGLEKTLIYTGICVGLSLVIGLVIALTRHLKIPVFQSIAGVFTTIFRETPLLLQIYFAYFALPRLGLTLSTALSGIVAIAANEGAFMAEIFRGGLQAIPKEQKEAALSVGMSRYQMMRFIIVPQAVRNIIPSLLGQSSYVLKDTSLLTLIAVEELTYAAEFINNRHLVPFTAFI